MQDDEVASMYTESLAELTENSKPIINSLTMIAEELMPHSAAIVGAIERKLSVSKPDGKLPFLYLSDSICKNVGGAYIDAFGARLPDMLAAANAVVAPKHMDFHFRRNMRGKTAGIAPASRRWMLPIDSWIKYTYDETETKQSDSAAPSVFDAFDTAGAKESAPAAAPVPLLRAPSEVSRLACFKCGEPIDMFYDKEASEWMLRDAVTAKDGTGRIGHSACLA